MVEAHFQQVNVFGGAGARGNETGVLFIEGGAPDPCHMQSIARHLDLPDTIFLDFDPRAREWRGETYSPHERIGFCVQSLLAAAAALRRANKVTADAVVPINVGGRRYRIEATPGDGVLEWVALPHRHFEARKVAIRAGERLCLPSFAGAPMRVDAGRRRIFVEMSTPRDLDDIDIAPDLARALLAANDVDGLCFYARLSLSRLRLRVFTTSLDGGEDRATGGAAASLAHLVGFGTAGRLTVLQGAAGAHRRGLLMVKPAAGSDGVVIGGAVRHTPVPDRTFEMPEGV
ncbi:PhzF family phenazine biosynthesis protein [Breoghania sp. JC706]|uniref:PhzF family phenazine biosynthesis protein n=1 Tax=Breoghania sp. JC706 TaxID=3117732 RepID=UPI00300B3BD0